MACKRVSEPRKKLIDVIRRNGENWPPESGVFFKKKANYEAQRQFAKKH